MVGGRINFCNPCREFKAKHKILEHVPSLEERFWSKVNKSNGCWNWTAWKDPHGYGRFLIKRYDHVFAHRMAWALSRGTTELPHSSQLVCHHCDNPSCVRPEHLFLGTNADNMADKVRKGRNRTGNSVGESNGHAKLTEKDVVELRALYSRKTPVREIAEQFGVSKAHVYQIVTGVSWAHVRGEVANV